MGQLAEDDSTLRRNRRIFPGLRRSKPRLPSKYIEKNLETYTISTSKAHSIRENFHWSGTWLPEVFALVVAIVLLVAITVTFSRFNGRNQPTWKYNLNLNAIAAIFSTIFRAMLLIVIEEGKSISMKRCGTSTDK